MLKSRLIGNSIRTNTAHLSPSLPLTPLLNLYVSGLHVERKDFIRPGWGAVRRRASATSVKVEDEDQGIGPCYVHPDAIGPVVG
jgi:hypothetical protein